MYLEVYKKKRRKKIKRRKHMEVVDIHVGYLIDTHFSQSVVPQWVILSLDQMYVADLLL